LSKKCKIKQRRIKMGKLTFNAELRDRLRNLRESLVTTIPGDSMSQVIGGGCGGTCQITCSWYCRADIVSEEIINPLPPKD
jgi:hypothetical protein